MASQTRTLAGITVPGTPLITKALAFAHEHLDTKSYNHVVRSWLCAQAIISHLPSTAQNELDHEVIALSTLLHDMGWSANPSLVSNDKCFEVDGANDARDFIVREAEAEKWDKHRVQLVWDAIALHTMPHIALFKQREVAIVQTGICAELVGPDVARSLVGDWMQLTEEEYGGIAKEFSREGLKEHMRGILCGFCRTKPEVTYETFVGGYGEMFVEGYSVKGKRVVDLLENCIRE